MSQLIFSFPNQDGKSLQCPGGVGRGCWRFKTERLIRGFHVRMAGLGGGLNHHDHTCRVGTIENLLEILQFNS
jgi:hypothetical protein